MRKILLIVLLVFLVGLVNAESIVTNFPTLSPRMNPLKVEHSLMTIQPTEGRSTEDTIKYDGTEGLNGVGYGSTANTWFSGVQFIPTTQCTIKSAIFYFFDNPSPIGPGYVYLCDAGTTTSPGTIIESLPYTVTVQGWYRTDFTTPLYRSAGQDFWVVVKFVQTAGGYPGGCDLGPCVVPPRSFISDDMITWYDMPSLPIDVNWNIRAIGKIVLPANDVGVLSILSPGGSHLVNTSMTPSASIKNFGTGDQTGFGVTCSIVGSTSGYLYTNTQTISLAGGRDTIVNLSSLTPSVNETLTVFVTTYLAGDENSTNDTLTKTCIVSADVYIGNGTTSTYQQPVNRLYNYSTHEVIYLQSEIGTAGFITHVAWNKASGTDVNPIDAVTIYMKPTTATTLATGTYDLTGYTQVYTGSMQNDATSGWMDITLDTPFFFDNTNNLQILVVRGYQYWISYEPYYYYTATATTMSRYYYNDVTPSGSQTATTIRPNIRLSMTPPPPNDVGVASIIAPLGNHALNAPVSPSALVKNFGTADQSAFAVVCTIFGASKSERFTDSKTIALASGRDTVVTFSTWTPTIEEVCGVEMATALEGDGYSGNDVKTDSVTILNITDASVNAITHPALTEYKRVPFSPQVTVSNNGSAATDIPVIAEIWDLGGGTSEDFEVSNGGYTADPATSAWEWGVPTSGPMGAHSGTKVWATVLGGNYVVSADWKLTTGDIAATSDNPQLKFWHWYQMEGDYGTLWDGGNVKISVEGGPWTVISPVGGYFGVASTANVGIPGESCYSSTTNGNFWSQAVFNLPVTTGQPFQIRWHFGSDPSVTYPGWYIDDVTIGPPPSMVYRDSVSVPAVGVGGSKLTAEAYFTPWSTESIATYTFKTYTELPGDMYPSNDTLIRSFTTTIATLTLSSPENGSTVTTATPSLGWDALVYAEIYKVEVDVDTTFPAPVFTATPSSNGVVTDPLIDGTYYWRARVESPGTPEPWSEVWSFTVNTVPPMPPGWTQMESMPSLIAGKYVADGGALVAVGGEKDGDLIFAFRGKSREFYMYTPGTPGTWTGLESIPNGVKVTDPTKINKKVVAKGASMCFDGNHTIYGALDWDRVTTKPSKAKLLSLGLDDIAKDLWP